MLSSQMAPPNHDCEPRLPRDSPIYGGNQGEPLPWQLQFSLPGSVSAGPGGQHPQDTEVLQKEQEDLCEGITRP